MVFLLVAIYLCMTIYLRARITVCGFLQYQILVHINRTEDKG